MHFLSPFSLFALLVCRRFGQSNVLPFWCRRFGASPFWFVAVLTIPRSNYVFYNNKQQPLPRPPEVAINNEFETPSR